GHTHSNGGGWVANTATVASSVYVGPNAFVRGSANISGNARIEGTAWVENATVRDNVKIGGNTSVWGGTYSGSAQIIENAVLSNCTVSGSAIIKGNALEWGITFGSTVTVGGDAEIPNCSTPGVYLQVPHGNNGRTDCDGKGASDASNVDVNAAYTLFTDTQMAFSGTVSCPAAALAVNETASQDDVLVYPNPVSSAFNISLRAFPKDERVIVLIYDNQGREVLRKDLRQERTLNLDAAALKLPAGLAFIKVISKRKTITTKLIVAK
ncbi:MAG TPA: T9SS type A sorting domain-containing protein, partial [Niastella sp.]